MPDQALWAICAAFYVADNIRFHSGRELIIAETLSGRWSLLLPVYNYRVGGRAITFLHPLFPFLAAIKMNWLNSGQIQSSKEWQTKRLLKIYQRKLAPFRMLATVLFIVFLFAVRSSRSALDWVMRSF